MQIANKRKEKKSRSTNFVGCVSRLNRTFPPLPLNGTNTRVVLGFFFYFIFFIKISSVNAAHAGTALEKAVRQYIIRFQSGPNICVHLRPGAHHLFYGASSTCLMCALFKKSTEPRNIAPTIFFFFLGYISKIQVIPEKLG